MKPIKNANEEFNKGYNCCQAVLSSYLKNFSVPEGTGLKIASAFGSGMRQGETCGAVTGAYMVLGLIFGYDEPNQTINKNKINDKVNEFNNRFIEIHGSLKCAELLGVNPSTPEGRAIATGKNLFRTRCAIFVNSSEKIVEELSASE